MRCAHCGVDIENITSNWGTPIWIGVRGGVKCGVAFHDEQTHDPDLTDPIGVEVWLDSPSTA